MITLSQFQEKKEDKGKGLKHLLTGGKAKRVKYEGKTYYATPAKRSKAKNKKFTRTIMWEENGKKKKKTLNYGHSGYDSFEVHGDAKRRKNFRTRSAGIRDGSGKLTKDNPLSNNYWNRRDSW